MSSIQIARIIVSFSWIYHGLFPKLVHIAPLEKQMTASFGFSAEYSYLITKAAGSIKYYSLSWFISFCRLNAAATIN